MAEAKQISLLEQTVVDVINKSVSSIEKGAEFLAGQLPDIAEQYLRWQFMKNLFEAFLAVILIVVFFVSVFLSVKYTKNNKKNYDSLYYESGGMFPWMVVGIFSFIQFMVIWPWFYHSCSTMIQIYVAPKVYLIEWAKSFL